MHTQLLLGVTSQKRQYLNELMSKITAYKRREQRPPAMVNSCKFWRFSTEGRTFANLSARSRLSRYARKVRGSARRFFFSVRRTHRELRRNDQLLKKVRSLATPTPRSPAYPGLHDRDVDTLSTGRCLSGRPTNVAIKTTRPDNNYVVW